LERIWKEVLLHQFHDILPGSSITRVYHEAEARSAAMMSEITALTATADRCWLPHGSGHAAVNDCSWSRTAWVKTSSWHRLTVPALGARLVNGTYVVDDLTATAERLENAHLCARFSSDGRLTSLWDKDHRREVLSAPGNDLLCFRDSGDAWDFPMDYLTSPPERPTLESATATIDGPQAIITQVWRIGTSTLTQQVTLTSGSRRLEFRSTADWRERKRMLRVRFPVAVHTETARCEIQFGSIARPTHSNTSWDAARYEVCAHTWVDLSEHGYGVALLNDCKYGHRLDGSVLDLNLLRSPEFPDPEADQGMHAFTYAIYPHVGDHVAGGVLHEAHDLNAPLRIVALKPGRNTEAANSFITVDHPQVVISAVKCSEDGDDIIIRLYESAGGTARTMVHFAIPIRQAAIVNLLEEEPQPVKIHQQSIELELPPFAVRTVRLKR
jgi:alpha-mannosidase